MLNEGASVAWGGRATGVCWASFARYSASAVRNSAFNVGGGGAMLSTVARSSHTTLDSQVLQVGVGVGPIGDGIVPTESPSGTALQATTLTVNSMQSSTGQSRFAEFILHVKRRVPHSVSASSRVENRSFRFLPDHGVGYSVPGMLRRRANTSDRLSRSPGHETRSSSTPGRSTRSARRSARQSSSP